MLDPVGEEIKDIRQHPELYCVNVPTAAFPNGAIRGQLRKGKVSGDQDGAMISVTSKR